MDGDEWTNQLFSISRSSWNSEEMEEWLRGDVDCGGGRSMGHKNGRNWYAYVP